MLGYDTTYDSNTADNDLLKIAASENRILLTRDMELYDRAINKQIRALFVKGGDEVDRLAFLAKKLQIRLDINMADTKCPQCGTKLRKVSKSEVSGIVPPASLELYSEYWRCANCGKVYWVGSHWKQIKSTLEKARALRV
jgi:uncharacterized protein with PIN domain